MTSWQHRDRAVLNVNCYFIIWWGNFSVSARLVEVAVLFYHDNETERKGEAEKELFTLLSFQFHCMGLFSQCVVRSGKKSCINWKPKSLCPDSRQRVFPVPPVSISFSFTPVQMLPLLYFLISLPPHIWFQLLWPSGKHATINR